MTNGDRRIATATGAMLSDPARLGNLRGAGADSLFDPEFWRAQGKLEEAPRGRGSAWFVRSGDTEWVLRHFRRGGFIARFLRDSYVWAGEERVRAFAEWRLLELLTQRGLPVPKPIAARYSRTGLFYRCDLIVQRIVDAEPLSAVLERGAVSEPIWHAVGAAVSKLHRAGVDHADLNAHNVLIGAGGVTVVDFDRGRLREQGREREWGHWRARNLERLRRSLEKLSRGGPGRFSEADWASLMAGYGAAGCDATEYGAQ